MKRDPTDLSEAEVHAQFMDAIRDLGHFGEALPDPDYAARGANYWMLDTLTTWQQEAGARCRARVNAETARTAAHEDACWAAGRLVDANSVVPPPDDLQ